MKPKKNLDLRSKMSQWGITQTELGEAMHMKQPHVSELLNKSPLSDAERQRILNGIEQIKNERWNTARREYDNGK